MIGAKGAKGLKASERAPINPLTGPAIFDPSNITDPIVFDFILLISIPFNIFKYKLINENLFSLI